MAVDRRRTDAAAASWADLLRSQLPGPILYRFLIVVVTSAVIVVIGLYPPLASTPA